MGIRLARPRFNVPGGLSASMQLPPPFEFTGVTIRVFPLRAKIHLLERFCDSYVNVIPDAAGVFKPFVPYVYLLIVDYGRMAVEAQNLGWLSQHEIVFTVPVEWYRREGSRLVFHDWGFVSPFIFVDNELSMTTGRQVYGWPKTMVTLDAALGTFLESPRKPVRTGKISAMVFSDANGAVAEEERVLLELTRESALARLSPAYAITQSLSLARDFGIALREVGLLRERPGETIDNWALRFQRLFGLLSPFDGKAYANAINLKQFRSAASAKHACYQAVTNSTMDLHRLNDAGLLGAEAMAIGDQSGGHDVIIHRYDSLPIIETLGIDVAEEWRGTGETIARVRPVFPFWLDVDVRYGLGETLAWRTQMTGWMDGRGARLPGDEGPPREARFINVTGTSQEVAGPFQLPRTTMRVFPLLASPSKLQEVIDQILNRPLAGRDYDPRPLDDSAREFVVWGRYVYLEVSNHTEIAADGSNLGWWADRDVTFYVPVKWYRDGRLVSLALFPVFSYANTATAAITGSEVSGIPMLQVDIASPPSTWMDPAGPSGSSGQALVRMTSLVFPSSDGAGLGARQRAIMEIHEGQVYEPHEEADWMQVAQTWGRTLTSNLARTRGESPPDLLRDARTMALEVLTNGRPINVVTMKQFRDVEEPASACYQSLVLIERKIEQIFDIREMEEPMYISLFDYASQPIVTTLGLVTKAVKQVEGGRAHMVEPLRPFWMVVSMREELGKTIQVRAGTSPWELFAHGPFDPAERNYFDPRDMDAPPASLSTVRAAPPGAATEDPAMPGRRLGPSLDEHIQECVPVDLRWLTQEWQSGPRAPLDFEVAIATVERVEPQTVISSILSREWENRGETRWKVAEGKLRKSLEQATHGLLPHAVPERVVGILDARVEEVRRGPRVDPAANLTHLLGFKAAAPQSYVRTPDTWEEAAVDQKRDALRRAASALSHLEHGAYLLKMANESSEDPDAKRHFSRNALKVFTSDDLLELLLHAVESAGVDVSGLGHAMSTSPLGTREGSHEGALPAPPKEALAEARSALSATLAPEVLARAEQRFAAIGLDLTRLLCAFPRPAEVVSGTRHVPLRELATLSRDHGLDLRNLDIGALSRAISRAGADAGPLVEWLREARLDVSRVDVFSMLLRWLESVDVGELLRFVGDIEDGQIQVMVGFLSEVVKAPDTPIDLLPVARRRWVEALGNLGIETIRDLQRALPYAVVDGRIRCSGDDEHVDDVLRRASVAAVTSAEERYHSALNDVLMWLCRYEEKPDFCVRCDTVLTSAQQMIFPRGERWRDTWYVGPDANERR